MRKGIYNGIVARLIGKTALLKNEDGFNNEVMAQFDDLTLVPYSHDWHMFALSEFEILGEVATEPKKVVIKMTQPREWEPDEIKPELIKQRLRDW